MLQRPGGGPASGTLERSPPVTEIQRRKLSGWRAAALAAGLFAAAPLHAEDGPLAGPASDETRQVVGRVTATGDNHGMPFVVVDKKAAMVFVFDSGGRLVGDSSVLLGLARGDDSAPGVGDKKLSDIRPEERTTPAGRFVASLGYGLGRQDILWVDYDTALALHRVSPASSKEGRLQRMVSMSPLDRRITFGCINVPAAFYDRVIHPTFSKTSGVVYILPETKPVAEVFDFHA